MIAPSTTSATNNNDTTEIQPINIKKPEVTITRPSSSLHSIHIFSNSNHNNHEKSIEGNSTINNNTTTTSSSLPPSNTSPPLPITKSIATWPIYVRLSSNGQDITIQVPIEPPYLTVGELRKELLPHLDHNTSSTRVKLIYLGRILPDQHVIVPTQPADIDSPLPPPRNKAIQIQKEGVIQAMVIKKTV